MKNREVDILTIRVDLNKPDTVMFVYGEEVLNNLGITLEQIESRLDLKTRRRIVEDIFNAYRGSLEENMLKKEVE